MTLLIDGDIWVFKALYIYQAVRGDKKGKPSKRLLKKCLLQVFDNYIAKFSPSKVVVMCKLFPVQYFRHRIDTEYKKNRPPTPDEIPILKDILLSLNLETYSSGCIETDDLIGLYMTENPDNTKIICLSGDKDLLQIPGTHASFYNNDIIDVTELGSYKLDRDKDPTHPKLQTTGFIHFCRQMIQGDRVDNVLGIRGLGPVKIFDYLNTWKPTDLNDILHRVGTLYSICDYHDSASFIKNMNLIWILRVSAPNTKESLELIREQNELQNEIIEQNLTFRDFLNYGAK